MISVITLTYRRKELLEEAIQSFLSQPSDIPAEMVVLNDDPDVEYAFNHPNVRIINLPERFEYLSEKQKYGFLQCKYDIIYRLDDDDLLSPFAFELTRGYVSDYPDYDVWKCKTHYKFRRNKYSGKPANVNTGLIFNKRFTEAYVPSKLNYSVDYHLITQYGARVKTINTEKCTMIYRLEMGGWHVTGFRKLSHSDVSKAIEKRAIAEKGVIELNPRFNNDYYSQLPHQL